MREGRRRTVRIVHIYGTADSPFEGAAVAVAQHIRSQRPWAEVRDFHVGKCSADRIIEELKKDRPDLAVFHEIYRPAFLPVSAFLRQNHIPYVVAPHGGLTARAQAVKRWKKIPANLLFFDRYLKGAAAIQFLSEGERLESRFADKGIICPNGTPTDVPVRMRKTPEQGIRFLFLGRPEVRLKGLDLMLDAIAMKKDLLTACQARFDLVGPDMEEILRPMIRERKLEKLVFPGAPVIGADKDACFTDADVFIQTSRSEGMPMGILEAAAHGLCCLATEGTRMGTDLQEAEAGIVCETNVKAIVEALETLLKDPREIDRMGANARRLAETKYDWTSVGRLTVNKYHELIGNCENPGREING